MVELIRPQMKYKTAHAYCMLDNYGYQHTLRICNAYCFPTATMGMRTRLNVKVIRFSYSYQLTKERKSCSEVLGLSPKFEKRTFVTLTATSLGTLRPVYS